MTFMLKEIFYFQKLLTNNTIESLPEGLFINYYDRCLPKGFFNVFSIKKICKKGPFKYVKKFSRSKVMPI